MDPKASARLEAQLQKAGILDALVIADEDLKKVRRDFPEFLDTVLYAPEKGTSVFSGLTVREDLETGLKESVKRILSHMNEDQAELSGILLKTDGWFHQGVLLGRADKNGEAEFVGTLARKRRKEQKIQKLETAAAGLKEELEEMFEKVTDKVCRNCENREMCLGEKRVYTYQAMHEILCAAVEYGAELNIELKRKLKSQCILAPRFLRETLEVFENAKEILMWNNRMVQNREGYAGQLKSFAKMIQYTTRGAGRRDL